MSALEKKEYLDCLDLVRDNLLQDVYKDINVPEEESLLNKEFQKLFESKDIKQQIVILKEICKEIQECFLREEIRSKMMSSVTILVNIYLNCPPKHTAKRLLASSFQNFHNEFKTLLCERMKEEILLKIAGEVGDLLAARQNVNMIYCLMENFTLGEQCLTLIFLPVLEYLTRALTKFLATKSTDLSPVEDNEVMHHCLATLQASSKLVQKCTGNIGGVGSNSQTDLQSVAQTFIENIMQILKSDNFLLDCKTSGSMCLTLLLKLTIGQNTADLILDIVFGEDMKRTPIPDWLLRTSFCRSVLSQFSPTSCLCLWFGILAQLDVSDLLNHNKDSKSLLVDLMLNRILSIGSRNLDTSGKLQMARTVLMWTNRSLACLKSDSCKPEVVGRLVGSGELLQRVLKFVWMIWEDATDVIRFTAKDIFESVIKVHKAANHAKASEDWFLLDLTRSLLLDVSWSSKGKYGTLRILAENFKVSTLLQISPDLAQDILNNLKEQTVACYASDLYDKLLTEHLKEISKPDKKQWQKIWVWPMLQCMMGNNSQQRTYVIEYVLPKLLKTGKDTLEYMISSLCNDNQSVSDDQLGALIMCLRRARVMGLLDNSTTESSHCLYGVVKIELVKQALSHTDDQARLDAFALLCENHKTSEPIYQSEFRLLKYFIQWNMKNQSPSFRQHMVAHVKKLFIRFKESEGALCRKLQSRNTHPEVSNILVSYKNFGSWLFQFLLHSLYPGSAFARRTTALSVLSIMVHLLQPPNKGGYIIVEEWKGCHIQTLMECMTDTFEDNKKEAFNILKQCFNQGLHLKKLIKMSECELLDIGLELAGSNRPQDCTTGAYLLRILLLQPSIQDFLLKSQETLTKYFTPAALTQWEEVLDGTQSLKSALQKLSLQKEASSGGTVLLLWILLLYLEDQLKVAKTGLFIAAATKPMYPTLHCIRYILFDVNLKKLSTEELILWHPLMEKLLACCLEISDIVSPVVQNSSPEGNVPEEAIKGVESIFAKEGKLGSSEAKRCVETVTLMPEYLIVCCWRNVKEVSLLLGQLTFDAPITSPQTSVIGLLTVQQNKIIGEYFKKQLMESIHRGAFELACAGFVKQCEMLWRCNIKALHQLPKLWLEQVMADIKNDDENKKLCATRRSAGIPFFVQTLVSTEPNSTGRPCFKLTMSELLQLALKEDTKELSNSKVHALNILRALYKDSRLGEVVTTFVADGLRAAILGFQSPFWAVRNSSTLLLSTMMTRIFGVKRSKDESNMSKKNCQTGRQFFHQYPALYPFLLNQLEIATRNISDTDQLHLHPGLYPVLMILGRLFQSPLEGADTSLNLAAFIPYVIRCSSSPVLKTRLMAARALQPLVQKGHLSSVMSQLLNLIPRSQEEARHSHIHGALVEISNLLDMVFTMPDGINCSVSGLSSWKEKMWLLSRQNPCYITKQAAFEVSEKVLLVIRQFPEEQITTDISSKFCGALNEEFTSGIYNEKEFCSSPGFVEYLTVIAKMDLQLTLRNCTSSADILGKFQALLASELYEVRLVVLDILISLFRGEELLKQVPSQPPSSVATESMMSLLPSLYYMALYKEQHFECQIKVFEALDLHPLLRKKDWKDINIKENSRQVLKQCLTVIESSSRDEVKAAVIRFTRWIIANVFKNWTEDCMETVDSWMAVLRDSVGAEKITDLQLAVAMVIQCNALCLLKNSHSSLGTKRMFEFWEMLTSLQQEDDLEVREVITMTLQLLGNDRAVQPSLTLDYLVRSFVEMHAGTKGVNCFLTLISWIINNESSSEGAERLFDKSEMNVFREDVLFYQILLKYCLGMVQVSRPHSKKGGNSKTHSDTYKQVAPIGNGDVRRELEIADVLSQLSLVADENFSLDSKTMLPLSESSILEILETIRSFLKKKLPLTVAIEKRNPFLKTNAFEESLLDQYKCRLLGFICKILSDKCEHLGGEQIMHTLMESGDEMDNLTYPNCFISS